MRNEEITLTPEQAKRVAAWEQLLEGMEGVEMRVEFTKRDGTERVLIGTMVDLYGARSDKRVVRMDTAEGPRSANLYATRSITPA